MKIAVVGATGLVGMEMTKVLEERKLPVTGFLAVASQRSVGKSVTFAGRTYKVISVEKAIEEKPDIAIFSAGAAASRQYAPLFAEAGTFVIDNSSAWRMDPEIPLVVPEVNHHALDPGKKIIANPNCSTIQLVMALAPLHKEFRIRRVVVATYQAVTGTGAKGMIQLRDERAGVSGPRVYPHAIDLNVIPEAGTFETEDYTSEEIKLLRETQKIIGDDRIMVTATAVRVPVFRCHSEAVNVEFEKPFDIDEVKNILSKQPGVVIIDDPSQHQYPMPLFCDDKDEVFIGRIRRDHTLPNGLNLWIVSDNLRKGAATNAVQIAESLIQKGFIK
jgi:aspartate-semialdehyde dehydrogenase